MKNTVDILNREFSSQDFSGEPVCNNIPEKYVNIASDYARIENAIAVLSDLRSNVSYICYGGFSRVLGLGKNSDVSVVNSIWEEEIFSRIHPDDLAKKHLQELCFFHFIKQQPVKKRTDYYLISKLRMKTATNSYVQVMHRMFYIFGNSNETLRLALCLYSPLIIDFPSMCFIVDSADGHKIELEKQSSDNILSDREKQVLGFIDKGLTSKDIAEMLCISINTVSRHRQDILGKLQVRNSIEACRIAKDLRLI